MVSAVVARGRRARRALLVVAMEMEGLRCRVWTGDVTLMVFGNEGLFATLERREAGAFRDSEGGGGLSFWKDIRGDIIDLMLNTLGRASALI